MGAYDTEPDTIYIDGVWVVYRCQCFEGKRQVLVPYRKEGEDVLDWTITCVQGSVTLDHRFRSPTCDVVKADYIEIPMEQGVDRIGFKP